MPGALWGYPGRFGCIHLVTIIALVALLSQGFASAAAALEGATFGFASVAFAVMLFARRFWAREGRRETRAEGWTLAAPMTFVARAMGAGTAGACACSAGAGFSRSGAGDVLTAPLAVGAVCLLSIRLPFRMPLAAARQRHATGA